MILGEPQILGQVKSAWQTAKTAGTLGKTLGRLFDHSFSTAKQVRTDTQIGDSPVRFEGKAIALNEISEQLTGVDIVISSTASPLPILGKGTVESALKQRRHRPIFIVDIAVPRDVETEVGELADVYLYTVDDLDEVIQENLRSREEAAEQAVEIIQQQVDEFMGWLASLDALDLIQDYRLQAEQFRDQVLAKAQRMIENGKSADEALNYLARTLTNKLLHAPSSQLREAGSSGQDSLLEAANTLFQLGSKSGQRK
jgi:glutamyl-tRNA reductase